MIVVTGATGRLGGLIVRSLVQRSPAAAVGASVRDPARAGDLAQMGVRVRQGDFDDEVSLRHAFEGASQVLLVSSDARREGKDALAQHATAIKAAASVGVRRIVYTSHMGVRKDSKFPPMSDHVATEELLRGSGVSWTALRNGFYAASAIDLLRDSFKSGQVALPLDGKVSWTAHEDLAEVAAAILLDEGRFDGPTPPLTGSQVFDLEDIAAQYSALCGRSMTRVVVNDQDFEASLVHYGVPNTVVPVIMGLYFASRAGEFAKVDPTLESILERPSTSMRDLLTPMIESFGT
ncbi:MAG: SDR family oxidoreductase [Pseudomonadota bacterium]|nr:SDR family oxidoreductase [Pseudomonadota bacterium]